MTDRYIKLVDGVEVDMAADEIVARQAEEALPPVTSPIDQLTAAVKALPVDKRTAATWGAFIGQCLLAIQNNDMEALGYLADNFQTDDSDYLAIIASAKQLFGLGG